MVTLYYSFYKLQELYANTVSEKAKGACNQFPAHFNQPMHIQHCIGIGSLARYIDIGEAIDGPPKLPCFHHGGEEF
jgi:hypothetical protein